MHIHNILFKPNHLINPFTLSNKSSFSTIEKVTSIALALFSGVVTRGYVGVIAFYLITAVIKAKHILSSDTKIPFNITPLLPVKCEDDTDRNSHNAASTPPPSLIPILPSDSPAQESSKSAPAPLPYFLSLLHADSSAPDYSYPTSIEKRRFPPIGVKDTIVFRGGRCVSAHETEDNPLCYPDSAILTLHPSTTEIDLGDKCMADLDDMHKVVIQQQATRGCTAAAAMMLIYDAGKRISISALRTTNLGNTSLIQGFIKKAGLTPKVTVIPYTSTHDSSLLKIIEELIQKRGSAIVSITSEEIGAHVIVIDAIHSDLSVRLRDPYHGWAVTVTGQAFLNTFYGGEIIQIG